MTVHEAFAAVMADVRAIEKSERNQQQGFTFRGIDNVMQVVGPALRTHSVFIIPTAEDMTSESYQTKSGTQMQNVTVKMRFTVFGPDGDSFEGISYGQSADAGDKAVTKAQSVAYRTFLLQALTVPTGDPDPDASIHERAVPAVDPELEAADEARRRLLHRTAEFGWTEEKLVKRYWDDYRKNLRNTLDAAAIQAFAKALVSEAESQDAEEAS